MKSVFILLFFTLWTAGFGQIIVKPIPKKAPKNTRLLQDDLPPLTLPFWDDFSTSESTPGELWEFSNGVEISATLAANPPSLNAATLDGIDSLGNFYDEEDVFSGLTDQLVSRRIDLSPNAGDGTIYFSFFWEAGGNVEFPEDPSDSLRLQFLNADSIWVSVWSVDALQVTNYEQFTQEILQLETQYRHGDFRFKFEAFGSQLGPFDSWHVDYVYLNNGRTSTDTDYLDRTLSGALTSLVDTFHEMPAEHFFTNPASFITNQDLVISNLTNTPHTATLNYELVNTNTGESYDIFDDSNILLAGETKQVTLNQTPNISMIDPAPDSMVFEAMVSSNFNDPTVPVNYQLNDTLRASYTFHNYYAYDDGSAEFAAGVSQNGSVAVEYVIPVADSLTHIDIYFPRISPTPAGKSLDVKVWTRLDGRDESRTRSLTVVDSLLDTFVRASLGQYLYVTDTIFIGYKQRTVDYLPVGLDRSNQEAKDRMYYLSEGVWLPNENANGILMIRPVFQNVSEIILESSPDTSFDFFPNPSTGRLSISGGYDKLKVWSLSGQLMTEEAPSVQHDLGWLESGVYILEIITPGGPKSGKWVKE